MRWMLWMAAAIAVAGVIVIAIGYSLPQSHVATRTAHVALPPDAVYSLLADVDNYRLWRPEVKSLERRAAAEERVSWIEESGGMKIPLYFEKAERPSLLVARIADPALPFGGTWTYRIVPAGRGSEVVITENGEVYNPFFRFMSRYVFGYTATLDLFVKNLEARAK